MQPFFYILAACVAIIAVIILIAKLSGGFTWHNPFHEHKGEIGERKVRDALNQCALPSDIILNDVIFTNPDNGMTSQIDHILISERGIFVIETKNYSGLIYGNDEWNEWTQSLNYGKTINKFHSPVKQNKTHIYLVNKLLNNRYPVSGLVVFVQGNTEHIQSDYVFTLHGMQVNINHHRNIFSPEEVQEIAARLQNKIDIDKSKQEHIENIRKMKNQIDNNICPRCGGKLILRNGKYGNFYGCENYPNCKFTKKDK